MLRQHRRCGGADFGRCSGPRGGLFLPGGGTVGRSACAAQPLDLLRSEPSEPSVCRREGAERAEARCVAGCAGRRFPLAHACEYARGGRQSKRAIERERAQESVRERRGTGRERGREKRAGLHDRRTLKHALTPGLTVSFAVLLPEPSVAERTFESMKKAKANYVPRLTKGLTFYEGPLREAIDAGEWDTVSSAVKAKVCLPCALPSCKRAFLRAMRLTCATRKFTPGRRVGAGTCGQVFFRRGGRGRCSVNLYFHFLQHAAY